MSTNESPLPLSRLGSKSPPGNVRSPASSDKMLNKRKQSEPLNKNCT